VLCDNRIQCTAQASPGNVSDGTPSAPMLPAGGASSRAGGAELPAALSRHWHGANDSYDYSDDADSPLPAWRRNTAGEGGEGGGGRAFAAVREPQHPPRRGSPQRRLFGGADGGDSRLPSHPLAFGSYVQPADGGVAEDQPPPSRPSAWPDAAPDSSPFRPRQVSSHFASTLWEQGVML
jgi:hypothetical protein